MTVTQERKWTDHRLDDLAKKVDAGAAQADKPLGEFRGEVNARFDKVDKQFEKVDERFDKVDARFEKVDERFEKVDKRFEKVEGKIESGIKELRGETSARFDKVDSKIDALDSKFDKKFDRLTYYVWGLGAGIITTLIASLAALIGPKGL
jgi:predicted  nucleic acid-binding Zn-ribbon protein